ncbi:1-deoxy-D-xylulose-5-phosphate synthase [Chitiniphilus shinanonensis]|uniref:1-deoxy-D-xylulose-5-phosphate synthase n=1 Tax=Chitiniphilus shinanonensis TaxID=553088 RepID=A0ABQ6BYT8_9NEIS|nr:1-deoxy-D-xylulose-5-phosphate synthase [Chitiniphilus shinanonensis]GLS05696.1 1-deoxy-D-xylulose-5-phosphate synthase [Chitiniphilus shinanonensis]
MTSLLDTITCPADLRRLERRALPQLTAELRAFLLDSISSTGGHFASNLGAVELTVALHYVFDTPHDRLVWDVGHQSYPHKILTGRRQLMHTMRKQGGLAGFPKREESEYDTFGVGHSSTSIGAALGFAEAAKLKGEERRAIAVIGDGAMTAGQAVEALFNAGHRDVDLLVILNDNEMSISPNVGAFNNYLARLLSGKFYNGFRNASGKVLGAVPPLRELAKKGEEHVKGFFSPATLFEELGFNYIGPIDGHDLDTLLTTLNNIKQLRGPQFLHVVTKKGQGYKLAVDDPVKYHAVTPFTPENGMAGGKGGGKINYTQVFGDWLCDMARLDDKLVGITPAMREGSGLVRFEQEFPERYFDVGIAEQHAVTFAGGLACEGLKPVVAIYSTFLQRGYDQLIHDVALQNLDVTFAIDRAGLVGADGPTHAGSFDLSYLRCVPNMAVLAPADENECRQMLYSAYQHPGPAAVRYPRGTGPGVAVEAEMTGVPWGRGEIRRQGAKVAILAFGTLLEAALQAGEALDATVANMRFVKPLDTALIAQLAAGHDLLVTVEENAIMGGAGSAVLEALAAAGIAKPVLQLGLPDSYVEHGEQKQLLVECGLDGAGIAASIRGRLA